MTSSVNIAARLHGRRDLRVEPLDHPGPPPDGWALVHPTAVGICGSDLHTFTDGRIGDTVLQGPLVLGHEFAGVVEQPGQGALDGNGKPLREGQRVAVDPAWPCGKCDLCAAGHPNLCRDLPFCGLWPTPGAMQQHLHVPASACFPLPDEIDDVAGAVLEPFGVGLHAADLAHIQPHRSVAILGAGPIGLCALIATRLAGAAERFIHDPLPWRQAMAEQCGGKPFDPDHPPEVDIVIECAWSDASIQQAADMLRPGGRMVVVGVPGDDRFAMTHSTARRKGLTLAFCRRMKHTYPRAIDLALGGRADLNVMVTHRFPLAQVDKAYDIAAQYRAAVVKVIIDVP